MNTPLVSVAMVVCNVERFLGEAIESILEQTFCDFEFIIVDFGSTDKTKEIVYQYAARESRIKVHEIPHCGLAEARNVSCSLARGKYIAVMDADDISLPDRLRLEVEFMEKHPKVGVVGGAIKWVDVTGKVLDVPTWVLLHPPTGNSELQSKLLETNPFCQPSVLVRAEAFVQVGGYRETFAPAEDYDLWLRISEHFELANVGEIVLNYRIHPNQVSVRKHKRQNLSTLATLAAAKLRRNGKPDPFDSVKEITPAMLDGLGIGEAQQESALLTGYSGWIHIMCAAGDWPAALNAGIEMKRSSDWKFAERGALGDMYLKLAQLYWKNHRFVMSIVTASHAVVTRPRLAARPFRSLLQRLGVS